MATPQITVGLDVGTHQTKVCVERKEGAELEYSFFMFKDSFGYEKFTLPSIIKVNSDNTLSYGYVEDKGGGRIIRYFKQSTFTTSTLGLKKQDAIYYSIWYLAYIFSSWKKNGETTLQFKWVFPRMVNILKHKENLQSPLY